VWSELWRQVWKKLADHKDAPDDIFCELFRELNTARATPLDPATELAAIVDDQEQARVAFRDTKAATLEGEVAVLDFLERAHAVIEDFGSDALTNRYFKLIRDFLAKYSLRYDLRRPFSLHPTLPGIFTKLIQELKKVAATDANMSARLNDFEEALRDLKIDQEPRRIRNCMQAQMNLLESIACQHPGIRGASLGEMCKEFDTWPHTAVSNSLSNLYGFSSDFPGVRHGKASKGVKREVEMRDLVSVSVILAGFTPYLTNSLDSKRIYSE
jgi:hypothetical protein